MTTVNEERANLIGKIAAEGFQVTGDPRDVVPPCVLVGIPSDITAVGVCGFEASIPLVLIAPGPGNTDASDWLLDSVQQLMIVTNAERATAGSTPVAGAKQRHPSYTMSVLVSTR